LRKAIIVRHRLTLVSVCLVLGIVGIAPTATSQGVIPRTVAPDAKQLRQTGIAILREAVQLAQFQQYEPALARFKLATQLLPNSEEAWALLGGTYLSTDKLDLGIQSLEKALSLNPKNAGVNFSLGSAYFRKANYPAAEKALQTGLKLKPGVPEALFDLGNTYFRMGRLDDAIDQYKEAVAKEAKFWPAINNIGLIEYEQGKINRAIQSWRAAIAVDEKATAEPKLALAIALYKKGDAAESLSLATAALEADRRYGDVSFLKENLWGERLIADAQTMLSSPKLRSTLAQPAPAPPLQKLDKTAPTPKFKPRES
jgi:tetratricopeptide (TPR) repeat protein